MIDQRIRPKKMSSNAGRARRRVASSLAWRLTAIHNVRYNITVMARMSRGILKTISDLHRKRKAVLSVLLKGEELAIGTVSIVKRRCGNPYCHCATEPMHEQAIFVFTDKKGKRRCQHVRREDEERLTKGYRKYQEFKNALRKLKHLNSEELELLRAFADTRALVYDKGNY
jgi:hypothetical protein